MKPSRNREIPEIETINRVTGLIKHIKENKCCLKVRTGGFSSFGLEFECSCNKYHNFLVGDISKIFNSSNILLSVIKELLEIKKLTRFSLLSHTKSALCDIFNHSSDIEKLINLKAFW